MVNFVIFGSNDSLMENASIKQDFEDCQNYDKVRSLILNNSRINAD